MLRTLKRLLEPEFEVVAMSDNVLSLLDALKVHRSPLLVLDLAMGGGKRTSLLRQLALRNTGLPIVVVGLERSPVIAREVKEAGGAAYVVTNSAPGDLVPAARAALKGRAYVSPIVRAVPKRLDSDEEDS
jgi:DNA-binding NarL/FixJ family response regulator